MLCIDVNQTRIVYSIDTKYNAYNEQTMCTKTKNEITLDPTTRIDIQLEQRLVA